MLVRRCYRLLRGNACGAVGVLLLVSALMACLLRFTSAPAACELSDSYGWGAVYTVWALVSALGAVLAFVSIRSGKRMYEI